MDEVDDVELLVERVAALDLGKAVLEACVRVPHPQRPGRRMQELRDYGTTTAQLLAMVAWLRHWHVQRVVMESTSTYWKGVFYLLEAEGFDCWLVNAREVKNVPGRAKTGLLTELSGWRGLAGEGGRAWHVPAVAGAAARDPPAARPHPLPPCPGAGPAREQQWVEKLLEDTQIKIASVLSDLHGVSGRAMMHALIAGWQDLRAVARLARSGAREKTDQLEEALRGSFTDHHATNLVSWAKFCPQTH